MSSTIPEDDTLVFSDEGGIDRVADEKTWKILVVDDDEQVHKVTSLALSNILVQGRKLTFFHAYSSSQALEILQTNDSIAVILLDVVMESDIAGLQLIKNIREDLGNDSSRIILRTGQPGYAPELEVIQQYDINDYKMKSELTRTRLITTITTAIRSYDQIRTIARNNRSLELIIKATSDLFLEYDPQAFAKGLMIQLPNLIPDLLNGLIVWNRDDPDNLIPLAEYSSQTQKVTNPHKIELLPYGRIFFDSLAKARHQFNRETACLYLPLGSDQSVFILMRTSRSISENEQRLLRVLAANAAVGYQNIELVRGLENYAYIDQLTGLPNKARFLNIINNQQENSSEELTIAIVDIDDFSEINDSLGHESGDQLLKAVADRLLGLTEQEFSICRISGDTFGILGPSKHLRPQLLMTIFDEPFMIRDMPFPIRITIGLAKLGDTPNPEDSIKYANIAMKRAKSSARSRFLYFSTAMQDAIHRRITISRDLKPALLNDEFVLYYQPQINIQTHTVVGAEALLRWIKPSGEIIPPFQFISVAESSGFISDLGRWVLTTACEAASDWKVKFPDNHMRVAVNVSMRQFHTPSFLPFISHILEDTGMEPSLLEIEITESIAMQDAERVIDILRQLKNNGISIAIDDFGTGFSSMNYLLRLPIDRLKVDRSFILNLQTDRRSISLTELVINLGKQLDLSVIAEGVENTEQAELVRKLGCHEVQGYLYARPMPRDHFEEWLKNWENNPEGHNQPIEKFP